MVAAILVIGQGEIWQLFANTQIVARIILLLLLFFSVFSWAIIFKKFRRFRKARRDSREFLKIFRGGKKLSEIRNACKTRNASPLTEEFLAGYREIENQAVVAQNPEAPQIRSLDSVQRALQIAASSELNRMEQWLT